MRYLSALLITFLASLGQAKAGEELPLELFAAHSSYKQMIISPDGKHIAFTYEEKNNEVKLAIVTSDMKKITSAFGFGENKHIVAPFWANNDRIVMRIIKNTGWLDKTRSRLYTVAANVDGRKRRRLFDDGNFSGYGFIDYLRSDPKYVLVSKYHFSDKGGLKVHKLNVKNGKLKYLDVIPRATGRGRISGVDTDIDEKVRIAFEVDQGEDKYDPDDNLITIHYKSSNGWNKTRLDVKRDRLEYSGLGFNRENSIYYFSSNMDMTKNDTHGLFSFNLETQQVKLVFRHEDVDVANGIYGPVGELIGVNYYPGYPAKFFMDHENKEVKFHKSIAASFKGESTSITSYTKDGTKAIIHVRSDRNPGDFYLFDRQKNKIRYLSSSFPKVKPKKMAYQEAFTMNARDGVKLYGLLTLPNDRPAKNLPMIVIPHGGPHGPLDYWGYNPEAQLFANRGYAVIQVNFRGSGGYGTDFLESGYRKWGREMQDDVTDATLWAVNEGIADINRLCLYGGSYGGYATLQGLVREPDLYKCGVGIAGVYSLPMMWSGDSDGRKAGAIKYSNIWLNKYVGKDQKELKAYSPAFNVDKIKGEIFIIHGSNDVRVPLSQAEILRENLDKIGKKYEWLVKEEGHGFTQEKNRIIQFEQVLAFFKKHIG